jgi:hypothetical protein
MISEGQNFRICLGPMYFNQSVYADTLKALLYVRPMPEQPLALAAMYGRSYDCTHHTNVGGKVAEVPPQYDSPLLCLGPTTPRTILRRWGPPTST